MDEHFRFKPRNYKNSGRKCECDGRNYSDLGQRDRKEHCMFRGGCGFLYGIAGDSQFSVGVFDGPLWTMYELSVAGGYTNILVCLWFVLWRNYKCR